MLPPKAHIIAQLQKDILLQYAKPATAANTVDTGIGPINDAFPNKRFPCAAVHEFCCYGNESATATGGFVAGILHVLMKSGGVSLWISPMRTVFPPAFTLFNIDPAKIIFIQLPREKDRLWAMEEALKCDGLAAVIGEIRDLDFNASRRLQLAVEQSKVTGFIMRKDPLRISATACVTRWNITSINSGLPQEIPGIGYPRWNVALQKVRNGKPGNWQIEWADGKFNQLDIADPVALPHHKKAV
jgi:protein ImuA